MFINHQQSMLTSALHSRRGSKRCPEWFCTGLTGRRHVETDCHKLMALAKEQGFYNNISQFLVQDLVPSLQWSPLCPSQLVPRVLDGLNSRLVF